MNDLVLAIKLTGDSSDLVGEVRVSREELGKLGVTTDKASTSAQKLSKESTGLSAGLSKMSTTAARAASLVSALATGAMAVAVKRAIDFGDNVQKLSLRLGASTEALSQYAHVAELTGVTFGQLTTAWQRQTRRIAEAAKGTGEAKDALQELGVSAQALKALRPEEQFEVLADALGRVDSEADRVRIAMKLWDTEGVALLQTIDGGSESLRRMREEALRLGLTLSQEQADQMAAAKDALTRLSASSTAFANTLAVQLGPTLESVVNWLNVTLPSAVEFASEAFDGLRELVLSGVVTVAQGLEGIYDALSSLPGSYGEAYAQAANEVGQFVVLMDRVKEKYSGGSRDAQEFSVSTGKAFENFVVAAGAATQGASELNSELGKLRSQGQGLLDELFPEDAAFASYADKLNMISQLRQSGAIGSAEREQEAIDRLTQQYLGLEDASERTGESGAKAMAKMSKETVQAARLMESAMTRSLWAAEDAFVQFVKTGKIEIRDLIDVILEEMLRLSFRNGIGGLLGGGGGGGLGGLLGGLFGGGSYTGGLSDMFSTGLMAIGSFFGFGSGGIMTKDGPLPLNHYATGGVVNSPQVRVAGERYQEEAIVPLPDGRAIPVQMQGGGGGGLVFSPNYTIDARGADGLTEARVRQAMIETMNMTIRRLERLIQSGGLWSKLTGRRY